MNPTLRAPAEAEETIEIAARFVDSIAASVE
jgi:hypothetical protein